MEVKKLTPKTMVLRRPNDSGVSNSTQQNRNINGANVQKAAPFKRNDAKPLLKTAAKSKPKIELPPQPEIKITNDMQVTDGRLKGSQMTSTASPKVRPTARRIREKLFQTLGKRINLCRFLDLCAGSGAVGIEAISRGAALATFVERSAKMCHFIKQNLETCKINVGHGEIVEMEILPFLNKMSARKRTWDLIYLDPPYNANYEEVLAIIGRGAIVREKGGVLIIEHHAEMFFEETIGKLTRRKVVIEGETALSFYERRH